MQHDFMFLVGNPLSGKDIQPCNFGSRSCSGPVIYDNRTPLLNLQIIAINCCWTPIKFDEGARDLITHVPCLPRRFLACVTKGRANVATTDHMEQCDSTVSVLMPALPHARESIDGLLLGQRRSTLPQGQLPSGMTRRMVMITASVCSRMPRCSPLLHI